MSGPPPDPPVVPVPIVTLRTSWDAYRSVQRYVWQAMDDSWEIRLSEEEGVFQRPLAHVMPVGPEDEDQPHFTRVDVAQTYQVTLYPAEGNTADESMENAHRAREAMSRAIRQGAGDYGYPRRIPLYDYDGQERTLNDVALESDRHPSDYLRVDDYSAEVQTDPDDPDFIAVVCRLRCTWRKAGRVPSGTQTVTSVHVNRA